MQASTTGATIRLAISIGLGTTWATFTTLVNSAIEGGQTREALVFGGQKINIQLASGEFDPKATHPVPSPAASASSHGKEAWPSA